MVDTAERRRRALEARLSSFNFCRSAREIPSIRCIRPGTTDRDGVVNEVASEAEDVENDATKLDASERISAVEVAAVTMILAPCCLDIV